MKEKTYKVSEITREKLINAAGELFSMQGTENVGVREITNLAGCKENAISYHFGGKEGLVNAVWQKALERFEKIDFVTYVKDNEKLLSTKEAQKKLITKIIKIFYNIFYENDIETTWINRFLLKGAFCDSGLKHLKNSVAKSWAFGLLEVYKKITKSKDDKKAQNWVICISAPLALIAPNMDILDKGFLPKKVDKSAYKQLCKEVTKYALYSIGLI